MDFVTTDIRFLFKAQYFLQYFRFTNNKNTWKTKINWVAENKSGYRIGKWICKYATWFLNRVTFLRIRFSSCTIYMAYSIFMLRFCVFRNSCCVFTNSLFMIMMPSWNTDSGAGFSFSTTQLHSCYGPLVGAALTSQRLVPKHMEITRAALLISKCLQNMFCTYFLKISKFLYFRHFKYWKSSTLVNSTCLGKISEPNGALNSYAQFWDQLKICYEHLSHFYSRRLTGRQMIIDIIVIQFLLRVIIGSIQ